MFTWLSSGPWDRAHESKSPHSERRSELGEVVRIGCRPLPIMSNDQMTSASFMPSNFSSVTGTVVYLSRNPSMSTANSTARCWT